jgi:hypothetical protein
MALELARMSLWLETYTPDRALGFLDHHLVQGDALLGLLDLGAVKDGIPDDAFKALTGDDKAVARTLAKLNRAGLKQLEKRRRGEELELALRQAELGDAFAQLDELDDDRLETVEAKRQRYEALRARAADSAAALAADLFLGAFLMPKRLSPGEKAITESAAAGRFPTTGTLLMALDDSLNPEHSVAAAARQACRDASVLHWPLAFPQVFARGGFDVVLGNPPWEMLQLSEEEFFASRAPEIAALPGARRKKAIADLEKGHPALWQAFVDEKFRYDGGNTSVRANPRFPLTAVGKLNTYALFAETAYRTVSPRGRAGIVLPIGIVTDDTTKALFGTLVQTGYLAEVVGCHEIRRWFPGTDDRSPFVLLTIGKAAAAELVYHCRHPKEFGDSRRRYTLTAEDFRLINPNTLTCPLFRSRTDAELTRKIYRNVPVLIDETKPAEEGNAWGLSFSQGLFNMTSDSGLFLDEPFDARVPLYEAKMIHQCDHRWATYERDADGSVSSRVVTDAEKSDPSFTVRPRYWVDESEVVRQASGVPPGLVDSWLRGDEQGMARLLGQWLAGYFLNRGEKEQGNHMLQRFGPAVLASMTEAFGNWLAVQSVENKYPLTKSDLALMQQYDTIQEFVAALIKVKTPRWFIGWRDICRATDVRTVIASVIPATAVGDKFLLMFPKGVTVREQACLLADLNSLVHDFVARQKVGGTSLKYFTKKQIATLPPSAYRDEDVAFIVPRVLELTYTAHDLRPWASDLGFDGDPFRWNQERRAALRAELDAYFARMYGLTREELCYVLDPAEVMGPDYPSETFRVLKNNEERAHGEYRTARLVLEAWDRLDRERHSPVASLVSA